MLNLIKAIRYTGMAAMVLAAFGLLIFVLVNLADVMIYIALWIVGIALLGGIVGYAEGYMEKKK